MSLADDMQREANELNKGMLPCPFCGQGVYIRVVGYGAYGKRPRSFINHRSKPPKGCPYHRGSNHLSFEAPRQAYNDWNRRSA